MRRPYSFKLRQCPVTNCGFLVVFDHADRFGHDFINCLDSNLLLCPFHKKLIICEMSLVFAKQIVCDLVLSCIVIEELLKSVCTCRQLIWRNLEVCERSFLRKSTKSPWLDAFVIFHNNSCLLELRGYGRPLATEYAILLGRTIRLQGGSRKFLQKKKT